MTFPGAGAQVYRNEAGEPLGWDYPEDWATSYYCDQCGFSHGGQCDDGAYDETVWCRACGEEHDSTACPKDDDLEMEDHSL